MRKRLRAELVLARSHYADSPNYVDALETFVKQMLGEVAIETDEELNIYYLFLKDYIDHGFRLSPINLNTCSYKKDGDKLICERCNDLIKIVDDKFVKKLINLKPYKIEVTNEYIINNNKFMKNSTPTKRFNGEFINLYLNKGGIINKTYIVIDNLKEWPIKGIIEPEDIKITIPVTMINNTVRNEIIFAVDHKSKELGKLLKMYDYHYERNQDVYYNIRNKNYK